MTIKLYKVNLTGLSSSYVIAQNPDEAYNKVRKFLDDKNFGVPKDRCLYTIELVAENYQHTECGTQLFV